MLENSLNKADWKILLENECKLRGFSRRTLRSYTFFVGKFLDSGQGAREYLLDLIDNGKSDETIRLAGFAVKFYLRHVLGQDAKLEKLPNIRRPKKLPVILSKKEIEAMIQSTNNLKHRLVIMLGYSAGLRCSELINLKWSDIDFKRNVIHVKQSKGKKDRIVMLSPKVKKLLNTYPQTREGYVFQTRNGTYCPRSVSLIIKSATNRAGIKKKVSPHSLRHAFATHLLENGVSIRVIKELLGHSDIKTTLVYTKVANVKVESPIDM
ncbi:MAG: tyrosine-type recombinase/integrase [Candidatus Woesearchaeota archaeon]